MVRKWLARHEAEGIAGVADRSSRPHRLRCPTPQAVRDEIVALRREKMPGQQIAKITGVSPATVSRVLRAARLSRMKDIDPKPPGAALEQAMLDNTRLRDQARACWNRPKAP